MDTLPRHVWVEGLVHLISQFLASGEDASQLSLIMEGVIVLIDGDCVPL